MISFKDRKFILGKPTGDDCKENQVDNNWHVSDDSDTMVAHCYGFAHSVEGGEPLARRIHACLNAFNGIETENISNANMRTLHEDVIAQRLIDKGAIDSALIILDLVKGDTPEEVFKRYIETEEA